MIHWEGYPTEEDTWEPAETVKHAQELIAKFHADYPDKPALPAMRLWYMHKEDEIKELEENPKLFHYIYGMPGEGFRKPSKLTSIDMIVSLNPQQAKKSPSSTTRPPPIPSRSNMTCMDL